MWISNSRRYQGWQIGKYQIIRYIGAGRYGVCFLAETNGRKVILKRLKRSLFKRNQGNPAFEIQILSQLNHPGVPRFLEIVTEKDFYGLALEHKDGDTVETMLFKQKHRFTPPEIFNIGGRLIEIIRYLHEKGIVHRDIRIPNVLINGNQVSLIDFGLARWADEKRYTKGTDLSYLGDFLLFLFYSNYQKQKQKSRPWYEELALTDAQRLFLKRLLRLAAPYSNIDEVALDFHSFFQNLFNGGD
ncbi:MAG TPA: protein kinase family protein [Bacillota bacterium]|nr:protein kinase family protein [Bacillota bacterium]